ncbi:UNVERIFIED_ORG: hypothetical protein M2438_001537 [Methylobacterium sp. SuP10 SLI 274]|nr:hypothetical protein [Methylorubrum extorquens]MDF9791045.1 hypothetical protein [Methylorubrum extorquens]MDF9862751.1 hypothetical protein [Methylorubrum pseudosasae]MDH6636362.1 hypothetical protein [Methylobacterium sp. SuP10 SLI 274]MDH6665539.1 hypothetical protein [Methylorubrum zatmanii]
MEFVQCDNRCVHRAIMRGQVFLLDIMQNL